MHSTLVNTNTTLKLYTTSSYTTPASATMTVAGTRSFSSTSPTVISTANSSLRFTTRSSNQSPTTTYERYHPAGPAHGGISELLPDSVPQRSVSPSIRTDHMTLTHPTADHSLDSTVGGLREPSRPTSLAPAEVTSPLEFAGTDNVTVPRVVPALTPQSPTGGHIIQVIAGMRVCKGVRAVYAYVRGSQHYVVARYIVRPSL